MADDTRESPIKDAETMRKNIVFMREKEEDFKTRDLSPKQALEATGQLIEAAKLVTPDKANSKYVNDPKDAADKRYELWHSAQVGISKLNAPDKVKGELFAAMIDAQDKVRQGMGNTIVLGFGERPGQNPALLKEGISDLEKFAEEFKAAEAKYGAMDKKQVDQWLKTPVGEKDKEKNMSVLPKKDTIGELSPTVMAAAKSATIESDGRF